MLLLNIFLYNYDLVTYKTPITYNLETIKKEEEIKAAAPVQEFVKEDPRKRMKIRDITVADDFSAVKYEETSEDKKVMEGLGKIENKEIYSSKTTTFNDDLEARLVESMNFHKKSSNLDGDLRLMNRSQIQGQRDLTSNRIRQHVNNNRRTKNYFEEELEREENKIWWENLDSDFNF